MAMYRCFSYVRLTCKYSSIFQEQDMPFRPRIDELIDHASVDLLLSRLYSHFEAHNVLCCLLRTTSFVGMDVFHIAGEFCLFDLKFSIQLKEPSTRRRKQVLLLHQAAMKARTGGLSLTATSAI